MALNPEDLNVETFPTGATVQPTAGGYCCTGCTSGCGLKPTVGYCESQSGNMICPMDTVAVE